MFHRKQAALDIRPVTPREEKDLIQDLRTNILENTYLLGLLQDYSLRGIQQMGWGDFYRVFDPYPQILYQDVTGLVVLSRIEERSIPVFAEVLNTSKIRTTRMIARQETVARLHSYLGGLSPKWKETRVEFPEVGMRLRQGSLCSLGESELRLARPEEAEAIAEGSAEAMAEEIGIETSGRDFDRLIRSKADLIEKNRYFILEEGGEILFQAYFSSRIPEASQIQGVWVPPPHRNRGIATRCVAEMCRRSFEATESLVLRVQVRNQAARTAYEKVGFEPFLDYRSIWYK